jgi:hypothetical protein
MNIPDDAGDTRPSLVENYRDYIPPANLRQLVEDLLESVPPNDLRGLNAIVLCNRSALTRDQRRQKIWGRNRKYPLTEARGLYYEATKARPAMVWLLVDNILKSEPSWVLRTPILRYQSLSTVLFHEIGHHIHAVHKPIYEGKENVADDWGRKLGRRFFRKRYWYLKPLAYLASPFMKLAKRTQKTTERT